MSVRTSLIKPDPLLQKGKGVVKCVYKQCPTTSIDILKRGPISLQHFVTLYR